MADIHLEQRQVEHRGGGEQPRRRTLAVAEDHVQLERAVDDVLVGDDDSGRVDDEARCIDLDPA
jgi:hypothetical protein